MRCIQCFQCSIVVVIVVVAAAAAAAAAAVLSDEPMKRCLCRESDAMKFSSSCGFVKSRDFH